MGEVERPVGVVALVLLVERQRAGGGPLVAMGQEHPLDLDLPRLAGDLDSEDLQHGHIRAGSVVVDELAPAEFDEGELRRRLRAQEVRRGLAEPVELDAIGGSALDADRWAGDAVGHLRRSLRG